MFLDLEELSIVDGVEARIADELERLAITGGDVMSVENADAAAKRSRMEARRTRCAMRLASLGDMELANLCRWNGSFLGAYARAEWHRRALADEWYTSAPWEAEHGRALG